MSNDINQTEFTDAKRATSKDEKNQKNSLMEEGKKHSAKVKKVYEKVSKEAADKIIKVKPVKKANVGKNRVPI